MSAFIDPRELNAVECQLRAVAYWLKDNKLSAIADAVVRARASLIVEADRRSREGGGQ